MLPAVLHITNGMQYSVSDENNITFHALENK